MLQVDIDGRMVSLGEFLEIFNEVLARPRCAVASDGRSCGRIAALRQGAEAEPRCLEHARVRETVH